MACNAKFIAAVRGLVDAVLTEHCTEADALEAEFNMEHSINSALTMLREIRAVPELSALHGWADKRLAAHACSEDLWIRFYEER